MLQYLAKCETSVLKENKGVIIKIQNLKLLSFNSHVNISVSFFF